MNFLIKTALILFLTYVTADALVENTKHNLSVTGSSDAGTIKATLEDEVCVFCHIPHHAQQGAPLWNREMPASNYTMYDSEYLRRTGYPIPAGLGSATGEPGTKSRMCLSCHDGTVAVGGVYMLRGTILGDTIAMQNVAGDGTMPSTAAGYIGTDLSNHHPVGYKYDASASIQRVFGDGSATTTELKATPTAPLKLHTNTDGDYIECTSCHDPHTENGKFLRMNTGPNHGTNVLNTCLACHEKEGWVGSVHQSVTNAYSDTDVKNTYNAGGAVTVADLGCVNCHTPHGGEGKPYLLRKQQAQTCFQGAAGTEATAACHGVGGAKDIKSVLSRSSAHPVLDSTEHTNLDVLYGVGNTEGDAEIGKGIDFADSQHAVCMDCHNPHKAQAGTHAIPADPTGWYPATPNIDTNLVSNVLQGTSGVEPTWPGTDWTQPTAFTTKKSAEREYQICMKCHSYWGLGLAPNGQSSYNLTSTGEPMTDLAFELAPMNASGHPVVVTLNNRTGSTTPKALDPRQLKAPWKVNNGNQTMYCSDCHGSDNELSGDPRGPHGSNLKYVLKGLNQYWPKKSDGTTLWDTDDLGGGGGWGGGAGDYTGLFCSNCHDVLEPHKNQWSSRMQDENVNCVECHQVIPHGSSAPRLLGYNSFPAPYNYNGNSLILTEYIKTSLTTVNDNNAIVASGCRCHPDSGGGGW